MADVEKIKLNGSSLNIKDVNAVSIESQSLTAQQKTQARENIGAASVDSVPTSLAELFDDSTHRLVTDVEKTTWNSTIPSTAKGASNGVAELDSNGKVPSSQLPSFVDDVIEGYYSTLDDRFYEESTFTTLIEPIAGKSWVDIPANKSYRWTGSVYVRVDEGVQIGETSDTAYAGNKGKANADAITAINEVIPSTATSQNPLATAADIPTDAVKYTAQTLTDAQKTQARTNIGAGTSSFSGRYSDLTDAPPLVKGTGTGGNTIGGTGGTAMNSAKNLNSYAYGYLAGAYANYAFAFGDRAFAGNSNRNTGKHAVAIGNNVSAEKDYEIAYGKFNQSNADTAFSIGDGVDTQNRHNLMELKTDGRMFLNGNAVKTEGGDDDNKLRLGQITANGKYGFGGLFTVTSTTTVTFLTTDVPFDLSASTIYKLGDFYLYSSSGIKIAPIAGYIGISKTGQWIQAENCYAMFYKCNGNNMTSIDVSMLDTSAVKNMGYMFSYCTKLTSLDLSTFDTSNVENMSYMFFDCEALTALDLSGFDTSKVQNMHMMFYDCEALTSLNLSGLDTSEVTDMYDLFYGCSALTTLDLSSFDMTNVTATNFMFGNGGNTTPPLTMLKTPKINPRNNIPLKRTLYSQDGTAYTTLPVTTGTSIELRQSWT